VDALTRERAISSGGRDNSIRVWKIVEESQLVYNGHYNGSIDCVKLVNEENFLSCGDDGNLCTWNVNRKKPLVTERNAHGVDQTTSNPNWISAIAAWNNTDVVASGSCDGSIRLWKCGERFKSLTPIVELPCVGWINTLDFSHGADLESKYLVAGIGKEHRLGRWFDIFKDAKNSIVIIPLHHSSSTVNSNGIDTSSDSEIENADDNHNDIDND
jgi:ribosomal RNA-processing protein 9